MDMNVLFVVEPTWSLQYIVIRRHHLSRHKMILLEISILHRIIINGIYFIRLEINLSKLTDITLGPFAVGHCLVIPLRLHKHYTNEPLHILEPNIYQSKVPLE